MTSSLRNGGTNGRKDNEFGINAESFSLPGNDTRGGKTSVVGEVPAFTTRCASVRYVRNVGLILSVKTFFFFVLEIPDYIRVFDWYVIVCFPVLLLYFLS